MGLARDLSMGPKRPRGAGVRADFTRLKQLCQRWDDDIDTDQLRELILKAGASADRMRRPEGMIYNAACLRYRKLTGEQIGPETGTY